MPSPRLRGFQNFNRTSQSFFCNGEGLPNELQFFLGLGFTFRPKESIRRPHSNAAICEFFSVAQGEIRRHTCRTNTALSQKVRHHFFEGWCLFLFTLHFALEFAKRNNFVRL